MSTGNVKTNGKERFLFVLLTFFFTFCAQAIPMTPSENPVTAAKKSIRVATFNIGLDQAQKAGDLANLLQSGDYVPALKSAEIIQRVKPDILLINEIDGNDDGKTLALYLKHYLEQSINKQKAIKYPHVYMPDCNTGVDSGVNFRDHGLQLPENNDSTTDNPPTDNPTTDNPPTDNYGFAHYSGQYCMAVLSKYPIEKQQVHTFQKFLWKDLPSPLLPTLNNKPWYSPEGLKHFRLSSKTHADVPVNVNGKPLHLLISHPTPPVFDGDEDRNGKRNHDEIKFWQYYINGDVQDKNAKNWLQSDDAVNVSGLSKEHRFIIMGDLNSSMVEGDASSHKGVRAIETLIHDTLIGVGFSEKKNSQHIPQSLGGKENHSEGQYSKYHTAHWKMRADYVLPSAFGINTVGSGVYWPKATKPEARLVTAETDGASSSDHRLVWLDIALIE